MITYISLKNGYVESGSVATISFFHNKGFKTKSQAIANLAKVFFDAYGIEFPKAKSTNKKCCKNAQKNKFEFCPKCGSRISNSSQYLNYFDWLQGLIYDTFSECFYWEALEQAWWSFHGNIWDLEEGNCFIISEFGPEYLLHYTLKNKGISKVDREVLEQAYKDEILVAIDFEDHED